MYIPQFLSRVKRFILTGLILGALLPLGVGIEAASAQSASPGRRQSPYQLFQTGVTTAAFDAQRAESIWQEMIRQVPNSTVGHYYLGLALASQGQHAAAEAAYREVLRLNESHAVAYYQLSLALSEQDKTAAAATAMRAAVNLYAHDAAAHCDLANTLIAQFRVDEAIAATQNALLVDPDYAFMQERDLNAVCRLHRFDQTAGILEAATALYPNDAEWPYRLGAVLDRQEAWEEAIAAYQIAIDRDPNYTNAYLRMSNSLARLGNNTAAAAAQQTAAQLEAGIVN